MLKLPPLLPFRFVFLKAWATTFIVPRHIVRIDIDEPGLAGTHGWQVRYRRHTKLFSDTRNSRLRYPRESLVEATQYLCEIYRGPSDQIKSAPSARKKNRIEEAGLRLVSRKPAKRRNVEYYVEVSAIEHGKAARRFYVGTDTTFTDERLQKALEAARVYHKDLVAAHRKARGVILSTSPQ